MENILFLFVLVVLNTANIQGKPYPQEYSSLGHQRNTRIPAKFWDRFDAKESHDDFSNLLDGIFAKSREANGHIIDVAPAGLVFDFKVFLPFQASKGYAQRNKNEKPSKEEKDKGNHIIPLITEGQDQEEDPKEILVKFSPDSFRKINF